MHVLDVRRITREGFCSLEAYLRSYAQGFLLKTMPYDPAGHTVAQDKAILLVFKAGLKNFDAVFSSQRWVGWGAAGSTLDPCDWTGLSLPSERNPGLADICQEVKGGYFGRIDPVISYSDWWLHNCDSIQMLETCLSCSIWSCLCRCLMWAVRHCDLPQPSCTGPFW